MYGHAVILSKRLVRIVQSIALVSAALAIGYAFPGITLAIARPGGGGSYHGGGGGGGGYHGGGGFSGGGGYHGGSYGGGGGGGGFSSVVIVLFVVLVIVVYLVQQKQRGMSNDVRSAILDAQYRAASPAPAAATLDTLRARDPALTTESIFQRVQRMSDVLREAWCAGDMRPARPFVSDGIFGRYQAQLALMRGEGLRNVMRDATTLYNTLEACDSEPPLDAVHVRFTARARDAMVPVNATPAQIDAELKRTPALEYSEIWSLVRRQGATTKGDPMQVGRVCPSCGAPLVDQKSAAMSDAGGEMMKCRYCSALVCSGEHDWVLAEITQVSEWRPASQHVQGLRALREADPGVAREALEDRASYVFWKWIEAGRKRSAAPLRKCATDELIMMRAGLDAVANVRDVAVGGADLVLCDPANDDGLDFVYVKIFWSAIFGNARQATPVQSIVRLARKSGVTSPPSMTALACASCGAPLTESDTPTCDHCGALQTAGDHAWVLDAIEPAGAVRPRSAAPMTMTVTMPEWMVPNIADPRERAVLFTHMAALMATDGILGRRERRLLAMCAHRWSIPDDAARAAIEQATTTRGSQAPSPIASTSPDWFLAGLVAAALADGKLDPEEQRMLDRACAALRLPPERVAEQLAAYRARLASQSAPI